MTRYNQLMRQFQIELQAKKYATSTISTYSSCLAVFLKAMNGKPKPLPFNEIKIFLAKITNSNYHKQFTATIHHFYKLVLKQHISFADVPYPRSTNYLPQILSIHEVWQLINSYTNIKHRAIIQLMYTCALRIGEVVKIQHTHINADMNTLLIQGAKGFKDRYVPLNTQTITLLRNYVKAQTPRPKKYLFEGWHHQQYTVRSIQQIFHQGLQRIKLKRKLTPHSLRHSCATHLHNAGVDIKDIADTLGHSHIKTTADYYLKLSKQTLSNRIFAAQQQIAQVINIQQRLTA